jgi:FMN phosphatase YigB (HAD superfamily)
MLKLLLADYGGVLGKHHLEPAQSTLATLLNVTVPALRQLLSERSPQGRAFREDRLTEREFWEDVVAKTGGRQPLAEDLVDRLSLLWAQTYELDRDVLAVFNRTRSHATLGVLTNIDRARSKYLENTVGILKLVDIYLPSYRFRATKPSEELWRRADSHLRECLGADVAVTYVDDRETHVQACSVVGWRGILFEDITTLEGQLISLGFAEAVI